MVFIEAPAFTRHLSEYLDDDQYRLLQNELASNPETGDVIQGTGGFRKFRWVDTKRGKGRRGGLRIIYYYFLSDQQIWLMTLYGKDEAADLTAKQKKVLKAAIETELKARQAKQLTRESKARSKQ
jgi:mRNA-degrading endonuclease RelE of RelBE toxin-antitoxin system